MRRANIGVYRRRGGNAMIESAMFLPLMFLLLFGMVELARVAFTYYTLEKSLYMLGRYLGTSQGVNFCDSADASIVAAKNFAVTGTTDGSSDPLLPNLTAEMISVRIERYNNDSQQLLQCDCSVTGCDAASGGLSPDYLVISIPDGYPVSVRIPFMSIDPIPLKPSIRLPYGGT